MTRRRTILLVDDSADDVELTLHAFERSDLAEGIMVARDGAEALDYLLGRDAPLGPASAPAVVLLDVNLPKINGFEVLIRIRADARTARLPVVMLTSSADVLDVQRSYELGANSFVRKPIDFVEFVETARRLGEYWLEINQLPPTGNSE